MDDLINKVGQIYEKQFRTGDWLEDRPLQFYHTNLPYTAFVDCIWWHGVKGIRIGEA